MRPKVFSLGNGAAGLALVGLGSCVEPYVPAVLDAPTSALVVDGFINGNGPTTVLLSRTATLAAATLPAEKGAKLFIVDDMGLRYPLLEKTSGTYRSDSLVLSAARRYQLRITTAGNATYESALVPLKITPPIEKLSWKLASNQVQIGLDTHDPNQLARYYRWGFTETWEFNSSTRSLLEYDAKRDELVLRTTPIYTCWRTEQRSGIRQGNTAQLSEDRLTDFPILDLSARAERVRIRYSVLVRQYAETAEEFAYYDLLRKNTEAVGTVNDPLPSQLTGNVRRVDNVGEPVLGFVSAHTVQTKRLFVDNKDLNLPGDWVYDSPYQGCSIDSLAEEVFPFDPKGPLAPKTRLFNQPGTVPVIFYLTPNKVIRGYVGSSPECADCRLRGSNVKPSFW
ncbi:MAG: DUF4249 domain-containing protein [Hymenobacter sp.]|nr:MAG: DUF4249 domain-containing protein [Hymenobacter sp.]